MNLFFDFDGTLIDSKPRLFHLFQYLVKRSTLTYDEYWDRKCAGMGHEAILKTDFDYTEDQIAQFQTDWLRLIEAPIWIKYDQPFAGVSEYLQTLQLGGHQLYLVTARQRESVVFDQLSSFGWLRLFAGVFVTQQRYEKDALIRNRVEVCSTDWFIGDTGKDIQAGKALGIRTAAVLSGFRSRKLLEKYNPDIFLLGVQDFDPKLES